MSLDQIHAENMCFIQAYAAQAMVELNARADAVMDDIVLAHEGHMDALEFAFERGMERRFIMETIAPFTCVEDWFEHLGQDEKEDWRERYQAYMYSANGDAVISEHDDLGWEVMSVLRGMDPYLKQPFCPYCDSRGHASAECVPH